MKKLLVILAGMAALNATAESYPYNLSLTPDRAIRERNDQINGATLSIWGETPQNALSIGLINGSIEKSGGFSLGIVNYADRYAGIHWGLVNFTREDFSGWQGGPFFGFVFSILNYAGEDIRGLQIGGANYAGRLRGAQIGLVNFAQNAEPGVQIGLLNLIPENVWFDQFPNELAPGMILVNWRF